MEEKKRGSFSGSLGFVLAAAGSAVGLGNLWRFPYLAARNGGGLFLVIYIILALTFGFAMLTTEIGIGRKTRQSPLTAFAKLNQKFKFAGVLACLIPFMILPYYCAIGGWVIKYFIAFVTGQGVKAAQDGYFGGFITAEAEPIIMMIIFFAITAVIVFAGVDKGIESFSKIVMPALLVIVIGISIYCLTLHSDASGEARTGLQGLAVYIIPNLDGLTLQKFLSVTMDAMGQLFFSLSVAMGIMIAYGSYVGDDANLSKSINQIEICDTGVAFLAGVMIIPAVFAFMGPAGLEASGPSLMFVSLPKVFQSMGMIGNFIGALFFAMVLFAALTSSVSLMEAVVASFMDQFNWERKRASIFEGICCFVIAVIVCLGYNKLYFEFTLPNGAVAQILDILDYLSNNLFMPIIAIAECILVGWVLGPSSIEEEIEKGGVKMGRKGLYEIMVKFVAPILLFVLFLRAAGVLTAI